MTVMRLPLEPTHPYYVSSAESAYIAIDRLDDAAKSAYLECKDQLARLHNRNTELMARYEDSHYVQTLDIAIPPHLTNLKVAAGLQADGIDVLTEKLRWRTYISDGGDLLGLDELAVQSRVRLEMSRAQQEALITGVGFVSVGAGDTFNYEPEVLVTAESPLDATVIYDRKQGRVTSGYARHVNRHGVIDAETLYLLDRNIYIQRNDKGELVVVDIDEHNANHVFLRPLVNRGRGSKVLGSTDLRPTARYYADAAVRTLLGMEINREFYTTPQRWLMGADMSMFKDKNGKQVSTWQAVAGLMLAAPAPVMEDPETGDKVYGQPPKVGQFTAAPPTPYIEQMREYKLNFAAHMGFPASYLGYMAGENPASADAIKALAQRLTHTVLHELRRIRPDWDDPRPDTTAADTDQVTKMVGIGMLQPDSRVAMRRAGMSPEEMALVEQENRAARARARAAERAAALATRATPAPAGAGDTPPSPAPPTPPAP
jgi:hypothetical protein